MKLIGSLSGNVAEVDANNQLKVALPSLSINSGFSALTVENDNGSIVGVRIMKNLRASPLRGTTGKLSVGLDVLLFNEYFPGSALNSALWTAPVTTMTVAVANNVVTLNNGSSTANGAVAQVRSYRHFPSYFSPGIIFECDAQFTQTPVTNNECIWGYVLMSGTSAPTDGAYFMLNTAGQLVCVYHTAGITITSGPLNFNTLIGTNVINTFRIEIINNNIRFWINDVLVYSVDNSGTIGYSMNLPIAFRVQNTAVTSVAQQMKITGVNISLEDGIHHKEWRHTLCGAGGHSSQGQTGGTMGSTANYANSANPTAAVPTNTTAALGTGLGGQFWETDTLAVTTDGIICSFQVPTGTATLPGKTLYITRITLDSFVQTVLVGGPYVANWSLAYGHTAVSLATTETATSKAPRRMTIGAQAVTAAQAVSTKVGTLIDLNFDSPIVVQPGEFVALVKKKVGTAPTSGVIAHLISIGGYFE